MKGQKNFDKKLPFRVPEGYFDTLPQRVQDRVAATESKETTRGWIAIRSQLAFAAGFLFMAVLGYWGYYMSRPLASSKAIKTDYVEIVSRTIYEFDDMDLYQAIQQKKKADSLKETMKDHQRFFIRSSNCISIIDEKKEVKP
ncbi:MAG: hypothetical protein PWR03_1419 [Tenuifilum sp.]|jgi:hypothetical protein|uniref:hypothetical protein n=1 Tax=Tenuifilum sp. TaxID=2760880 RepID=UPI0024ABDCAD|nr:hypothetical protein [Tenuifilum sp.]MDI3527236.1 hypothetical protein [Tenuifilum sp.]